MGLRGVSQARGSRPYRGECEAASASSLTSSARVANGGVMMYLADSSQLQELRLKGSQSGKDYIGPAGDTPGMQDREIVSFDGRVLLLKFVDPGDRRPLRHRHLRAVRAARLIAAIPGTSTWARGRLVAGANAAACRSATRLRRPGCARARFAVRAHPQCQLFAISSPVPGVPSWCSASRRSWRGARSSIRRC